MSYSLEKVTALIGAHRFGTAEGQVDWLLTDSRSLVFPETTLFLRCILRAMMAIVIFRIYIVEVSEITWSTRCL